MRKRTIVAIVAALACTAGAAIAATYTWNGSSGSNWTSCSWDIVGNPAQCYPSTTGDDAIIVYDEGIGSIPYTINMVTESIDDLTIMTDVTFQQPFATPTLTVDSISISGPAEVILTDTVSITG